MDADLFTVNKLSKRREEREEGLVPWGCQVPSTQSPPVHSSARRAPPVRHCFKGAMEDREETSRRQGALCRLGIGSERRGDREPKSREIKRRPGAPCRDGAQDEKAPACSARPYNGVLFYPCAPCTLRVTPLPASAGALREGRPFQESTGLHPAPNWKRGRDVR